MKKQSVFMGTTKIEATKTIAEMSTVLLRAGARQIATDYGAHGRVEAVRFSLPVVPFPLPIQFRLPCRTEKLLRLLRNDHDQAERTGWRQVLRWVEAQCALVDAGMVKTEEVFQPYALIPGTDKTLFQAWEESRVLAIAAPEGR